MGFKDGFRKAKPVLLEPIMKVEVVTPGRLLWRHRRRFESPPRPDHRHGGISPSGKVVTAEVPLAEMFQYSTAMRSMSQGRANYTMEFAKYMEVPSNVADAVMKIRFLSSNRPIYQFSKRYMPCRRGSLSERSRT